MMSKFLFPFAFSGLLVVTGCNHGNDKDQMQGMSMGSSAQTQPSTDASAMDLHNTVCPVSGDKVGDSKLTATYKGKIYHLCCDDCPKKFSATPDKYSAAVAANPDKYGVR